MAYYRQVARPARMAAYVEDELPLAVNTVAREIPLSRTHHAYEGASFNRGVVITEPVMPRREAVMIEEPQCCAPVMCAAPREYVVERAPRPCCQGQFRYY